MSGRWHAASWLAPLALLAAPQTQQPKQHSPLDGIWRFVFNNSDKPDSPALPNKSLTLKWTGNDVQIWDPGTGTVFSGKPQGAAPGKTFARFTVGLPVRMDEPGLITTSATHDNAELNAYFDGDKLSGVVLLNHSSVPFRAIKLPSAWECSGHPLHKPDEPAYHIASDADEMRNYSSKYGCKGWHKL